MTDRMEVTEWAEGDAQTASSITIRHGGAVGGTGRIDVVPLAGNRSRMSWTEDLHFAPWLGGPLWRRGW